MGIRVEGRVGGKYLEKFAEFLCVPVQDAWNLLPHDNEVVDLEALASIGSETAAFLAKLVEEETGVKVNPLFAEDSLTTESNLIQLTAELAGLEVVILAHYYKPQHLCFKSPEEFEEWVRDMVEEAVHRVKEAAEKLGERSG